METSKITQRKLAYSPVGMELENEAGWGTLLFTTSKACNLGCDGCWTDITNEMIKGQLETGAHWLYEGRYGIDVLDAMLKKFVENGGKLAACMSDGEPMVPANYDFTLELARHCGKAGIPLLFFTNGVKFEAKKLAELEEAAKGRISFCVSMQTGIRERYGELMLKGRISDPAIRKRVGEEYYGALLQNMPAWKEYDERTLERTGMHGVALHTYIIPHVTEEADMESIKDISSRLGDVPWVVSKMGTNVLDSLSGKESGLHGNGRELIEKYHTGPTATLSFGDAEEDKQCAYISHGFYNLGEKKGAFGMTFHPYYEGQVQTCPYHSEIGTKGWFKLKEYLDARKLNGQPVTEEVIWEWMQAAAKAMAMVTTAIYDLVGYEHCLTRHSRKAEVDLFINAVNKEMRERKVDGRMEIGNINSALENLRGSIAAVLARNGLKEETDRRQKLSEVFARAPRPTGRVAPLQPLRQAI